MNLAKVLKQKRDAEARLRGNTVSISYTVDGTGNTPIPTDQIQTTPYTLPQATVSALGGIKADARTTESNEVKIDTASGKLYAASSGGGGSGIFDFGLITESASSSQDWGSIA